MTSGPSTRLTEIRNAIAVRLRSVCADWPDDVFNAMVENLAAITLKYESLGSGNAYNRRSTERLLNDVRDSLDRGDRDD